MGTFTHRSSAPTVAFNCVAKCDFLFVPLSRRRRRCCVQFHRNSLKLLDSLPQLNEAGPSRPKHRPIPGPIYQPKDPPRPGLRPWSRDFRIPASVYAWFRRYAREQNRSDTLITILRSSAVLTRFRREQTHRQTDTLITILGPVSQQLPRLIRRTRGSSQRQSRWIDGYRQLADRRTD